MKTNYRILVTLLAIGTLICATSVQAGIVAGENFDALTGSASPGTALGTQGGWTTLAGSPTIRNDLTTGSLDGNVYYGSSNSAQAYRNDGSSYVDGANRTVVLSFTGLMGSGRWSRAGVGYYNGISLNPGVYFGAQATGPVWAVYLGSGTGGGSVLATSADGFASAVFDLRLTINLATELATLEVENSEAPGINWFTPSGMANIDLSALDSGATDGRNPLNWNSLYIRNLATGDTIDNLLVQISPEPSSAILALFGLVGCVICRRRRRRA